MSFVARTGVPAMLCLGLVLLVAVASGQQKSADEKLEWMRTSAAAASHRLIRMGNDEFRDYVLRGPRNYNVAVLFTAKDPRFACKACTGIGKDIPLVSEAVYEASQHAGTPTFVVEMDFDYKDVGQTFNDLGMTSAPLLLFVHPYAKQNMPKSSTFVAKASNLDKFDFNSKGFTGEAVLRWINSRAGDLSASISRPFDWAAFVENVGVPALSGVVALAVLGPLFWRFRKNTSIYLLASFAIYLFCVSGGMYNILKETPWAHFDDSGEMSYVHGGSGWQLTSESYICGGVQLAIGIVVIFLSTKAVEVESPGSRQVMSVAALITAVYLWAKIRHLVSYKMGGYNDGWVYKWV